MSPFYSPTLNIGARFLRRTLRGYNHAHRIYAILRILAFVTRGFGLPKFPKPGLRITSTCLLLITFLCHPIIVNATDENAYQINAGDELLISVWKEADLKQQVLVLPDGTINFPMVGQLKVEGRSPHDVEQTIAKSLQKYIPGAVVTLSVLKTSGNKIYVIGQVNKPGEYAPLSSLNVMQALSVAGGLTEFASETQIMILRRVQDKKTAIAFPYSEIEKGRNLEKNIDLQAGDVVVVPARSLF